MKTTKFSNRIFVVITVSILFTSNSKAQIQLPQNDYRHIVKANFGYDHNLISVNIGYAYFQHKLKTAAFIDVTQGTALIGTSNLRTQIGLQTWQGSVKKLNIRTLLAFVYTHSSNNAGSHNALGLNVQVNGGLQWNRWGLGTDIQYNPFFVTHIKHSDFYRQYYYNDVKDGWYKNTTDNLRIGGYLLVSLDKAKSTELSIRGGYQTSGKLDKLIPPFYGVLGFNKKF